MDRGGQVSVWEEEELEALGEREAADSGKVRDDLAPEEKDFPPEDQESTDDERIGDSPPSEAPDADGSSRPAGFPDGRTPSNADLPAGDASTPREPCPDGEPSPEGAPARTPPDPTPLPAPGPDGTFDLQAPELYLNREITWLNFNYRVLHEAQDPRTPLLERVKFLAIVGSNLDEFFMKRIGGLKQQLGAGMSLLTVDGRTPREQIDACYAIVRDLERKQHETCREVRELLKSEGIIRATYADLTAEEIEELRGQYIRNIYPLVTPQGTDPAHPFPFISNLSLNLLVHIRYEGDVAPFVARVKVPVGKGISRFLWLRGGRVAVPLEQVMMANLDLLFPGMSVESCELFRVTRNANTELEEETADDLLAMIETELRERRFAPIVRLEVEKGMEPAHRSMLAAELGLDEEADVFEKEGLLGHVDLWEIARLDVPELKDPPHAPVDNAELSVAPERSIFHVIRDRGAILVHHPYESFKTSVERFLMESARDPKVRAIKMTFYRTSEDTKALDYLVEAAKNGKQVAVVIELKARFDEEANIRWARGLSEAGIHVTYGVVGLKTHCKVILVVRQDYDGLRRYAHIGTGNYHAVTARLYSDLGLFTCDPLIGQDLTELFNYLTTGFKPHRSYHKILKAPKAMKKEILDRIQLAIDANAPESPSLIQLKLNALEDPRVVRALYEASQAGVKVDLIIRDSCRLRPRIPGLSDTITVVSVVGRFLEHYRIFYFRIRGQEEYLIGSADAMKRNLSNRIEVLAPVEDPDLQKRLRFLLDLQLNDRRSAWEMQPDGSYVQLRSKGKRESPGSQELLIRATERRKKEAVKVQKRKPRVLGPRNGFRKV
jgi:polyphosphate kinase